MDVLKSHCHNKIEACKKVLAGFYFSRK